jgi:cell division septum initiation protein DivIVA
MTPMSEPTSDLLPLYESSRGFDTAMRGYDREQVDREVSRLDDDLRVTAAERDSAAARSADLAAQLASAQAQAESLRRQLRAASEGVTVENVDERVKGIFNAARTDAARLREDAQTHAEQVRNGAADSAARTRSAAQKEADRLIAEATARKAEADETFRKRIAEAEAHKAEVEKALAEAEARTRADEARLTAEAEAERTRLNAAAAEERARLDHEAARARELVNEDFEITLRIRRTTAATEHAEQKRAAEAFATKTVADARAAARQLIADATHEVRRLHAERDRTHAQLDTLYGALRAALDHSLAQTPPAPELPDTGSVAELDERPRPST